MSTDFLKYFPYLVPRKNLGKGFGIIGRGNYKLIVL